MTRTLRCAVVLAVLLLAIAAPVRAQNKQELQMFAELRMMQERMQQLQLDVNRLVDLIKSGNTAIATRVDAQDATLRNNYAQQKAQVDSMATQFSTLAEQVRDNNVRVGQMSTEMAALREGLQMVVTLVSQVLAQIPPPNANAPPTDPPPSVVIPPSPKTIIEQAMGFYAVNNQDLAIAGFEEYLAKFPNGADAARAQYYIGLSYAAMTPPQHTKAVEAFALVISNPTYKGSDYVPQAYFQQGLAYEKLKKPDLAIKNYQTLVRDYKDASMAIMASGALDRLKVKKG